VCAAVCTYKTNVPKKIKTSKKTNPLLSTSYEAYSKKQNKGSMQTHLPLAEVVILLVLTSSLCERNTEEMFLRIKICNYFCWQNIYLTHWKNTAVK